MRSERTLVRPQERYSHRLGHVEGWEDLAQFADSLSLHPVDGDEFKSVVARVRAAADSGSRGEQLLRHGKPEFQCHHLAWYQLHLEFGAEAELVEVGGSTRDHDETAGAEDLYIERDVDCEAWAPRVGKNG